MIKYLLKKFFGFKFGADRRRFVRVAPLNLKFKVLDPDYRTELIHGIETRNISMGGCCFTAEKWVPEKALMLIVLEFNVGSETHRMEATSEALRIRKIDNNAYEIGASFLDFGKGDNDHKLLEKYIKTAAPN